MLRLLLIVLFVRSSAFSADNIFKKCRYIPFCDSLRDYLPSESFVFRANIDACSIVKNILRIPLKNEKGNELILKLSLLEYRKARVKIEETGSNRFDLKNIVIEEYPKLLDVEMNRIEETVILSSKNQTIPYKAKIVKTTSSFKIEFYHNEELDVILDGKRLTMKYKYNESYAFGLTFHGATKLYGLSYHADTLVLRDTKMSRSDPFRFRNSDAWNYEANTTKALYGTIPFIYGHSSSKTYGVFLHNAAEQWIDITYTDEGPSAYFMVESAAFDLFVLFGPTTKETVRQLVDLTGKANMPQLWTLGYHQSRFSYKSEDDVKEVVAQMDLNNFTMDAIWLDGDHANYSKWFEFNETTFQHPLELMRNISSTGRKCVSISDPHIKVDDTYSVYAGAKNNFFIKTASGEDYTADCWPGLSSWIDYMHPNASDYYASWFAFDKFNGTTSTLAGIWNDMNEPAVFDESNEKTVPFDALHYGNVKHRDIHNIYGFLQTRATYNGLLIRDKGKKRPFILTRSHFAGSQRYAAMWTGDNVASWDHLAIIYPECMISNLGGMVFCGADIGGFIGEPSNELLQRWYQAAVWTPFFRGHSSRESKRREPYLFNDKVKDVVRNAIRLRYRHIPVFYSLFYQHTKTGDPIIRPLFYEYPGIFERDNHLLLGTDIMAVAITKPNITKIEVQIPGKTKDDCWYRIDSDIWSVHKPGVDTIPVDIRTSPVFYRCGSIIVTKDIVRRSTADTMNEPYTVYVNLDRKNTASGIFYIDDFVSFDYLQNKYLHVALKFIPKSKGLDISYIDGNHTGFNFIVNKIIIHSSNININIISESPATSHTKTRDGTSLLNFDISSEILKGNNFFIPL